MKNSIIFIPFIICGISMIFMRLARIFKKESLARLFSKLYTIGFLLFFMGFIVVAAYVCIRDKNFGMLLYLIPFLIAGIFIIKNRLFKSNKNKESKIAFGFVVMALLVVIAILAGIAVLIIGIKNAEFALIFFGAFFILVAFAFVLGALTMKGCFDNCKIDVLGLYAGVVISLIGVGMTAIILMNNQGIPIWIVIPLLMTFVGGVQIKKCIKAERKEEG